MTASMPRCEAPRRINGATEVGKSMPPAVHSRDRPAATSHRKHIGERGRADRVDAARQAPFSQRFCGRFAFDDLGRAQAFQIIRLFRPPARSRDLKATVAKNCNRDRAEAAGGSVVRLAPVAPPAARRSAN
jgi:hypothetical protein